MSNSQDTTLPGQKKTENWMGVQLWHPTESAENLIAMQGLMACVRTCPGCIKHLISLWQRQYFVKFYKRDSGLILRRSLRQGGQLKCLVVLRASYQRIHTSLYYDWLVNKLDKIISIWWLHQEWAENVWWCQRKMPALKRMDYWGKTVTNTNDRRSSWH